MANDIPQETPAVAIVKATYDMAEAQIREALRLLGYTPRRRQLLLKPNLVSHARWLPDGGVPRCTYTDVRFLEALLRIFAGYEIVIAEGSVTPFGETMEKTGVAALARRYGAEVVDLDHTERIETPWKYGMLRLPALLQTHEYINVPKLKTHTQTGVTLGCKNQKGLLRVADKIRFHREFDLHEAIHALADAVQPALTIVDGIVGMEGPGPGNGRPRQAHLIVAGRDLRAVDVACCDLISVPLERVPHLDRVPYHAVGRTVEEMRLRFDATSEMVVANMHIHASPQACSRCAVSMHEGGEAFWRSPYHLVRGMWSAMLHRMDVMMGQGHGALPEGHGRVVCYGDCTRELAEKYGLLWIPGCPPSAQDHLKMY
jgi:uncharacterized protein (DUF362 family)